MGFQDLLNVVRYESLEVREMSSGSLIKRLVRLSSYQ